jgi:cysteine desulfurase
MLYFDHNATSPLHPVARRVWLEAAEDYPGNPSSPHRVGARADTALGGAREKVARWLGCDALDVVWTSGATESGNTVFHHAARSLAPDTEAWLSAIEHPCVLEAARHYFPKNHRLIPVTRGGVVDLDWLEKHLAQAKKLPGLLALMAANNETGVLQPWREVLALCRRREVPFFCDAVQWTGKMPMQGLGDCDFVSASAHKFGGPRGVGFLKCPAKGRVEPLLYGGSQEEGRRAGTENVPGVLAMVAALEARIQDLEPRTQKPGGRGQPAGQSREISSRLEWRDNFARQLPKSLPGAQMVGAGSQRLWNTVSAVMPEIDCRQRWVVKLDKLGFAVSTGSACASGKEAPSHVMTTMGYAPAEAARVLRFSSGWETTEAEWLELGAGLRRAFHEMLS